MGFNSMLRQRIDLCFLKRFFLICPLEDELSLNYLANDRSSPETSECTCVFPALAVYVDLLCVIVDETI